MPIIAIAVRPIDLAIFGTLGALWIGGALFILVLYRWISRFEREQGPAVVAETPTAERPQAPQHAIAPSGRSELPQPVR